MKRIVFLGTRKMGLECLKFLLNEYKDVLVAVLTLDESKAKNTAGFVPFDTLLKKFDVDYFKIKDINSRESLDIIRRSKPDILIQVAWSQIISKEVLEISKITNIAFHASLLPAYRGGSPVNWALIRGEKSWGTTMYHMTPNLDNGDIIGQKKFRVSREDTCKTVYEKVTRANVVMLKKYLPMVLSGSAPRKKQPAIKENLTPRRKPEDGLIDWTKTSLELYNWIRAQTHPYPGAFTYWRGKKVYIWRSRLSRYRVKDLDSYCVGQIIRVFTKRGLLIKTSDGVLLFKKVQVEGQKEDFASNVFKGVENGYFGDSSSSR